MPFDVHKDLLIEPSALHLLEKVGAGSYGEVWKGKWNNVIVGIKILLIQFTTPETKRIIEREINIAARLRHPHVVQIYGASVKSDSEIWLVMEFADGGNLCSKLADKNMEIPWDTRAKWINAAVLAVGFLHSCNPPVVHRDIKSPNFLFVKGELKLTDFGMSGTAASLIKRSGAIGSARWLAPETTLETPEFTEKSDVFSLGMVLWEIASREIPFSLELQDFQVIYLIKQGDRPSIPNSCPFVPSMAIKMCFQSKPSLRPTAAGLFNLLENYSSPLPDFVYPMHSSSNARKKYFEVNYGDLLAVVPQEQVRVLTDPPPIPNGADISFSPPPRVEIVTLIPPPTSAHMLVSERYDVTLFSRVSEYFARFYVPQNTHTQVKLESVEVIFNSSLEAAFRNKNDSYESMYQGSDEFTNTKSKIQQRWLSHLLTSPNLVRNYNSNPISAWHGAAQKNLDSICWYGLLNLSTNDPGYYGKGIYLTQAPSYGEYYAENKKEEKLCLLLCWVLVGRPRAVTKVQLGRKSNACTSHYILVKKKDLTRSICETDSDFDELAGMTTYFPVEENEEAQGDEIVVFESAQVLPRFIVHYSLHPTEKLDKQSAEKTESDGIAKSHPKEFSRKLVVDVPASAEELTRELEEVKKSQELNNHNLRKRIKDSIIADGLGCSN